MEAASARDGFSQRLRQALDQAGWRALGASGLAREFNARSDQWVTVHAARKWLMGEAIPTQERVQALASWLGVSSQWLRFGDAGPGVNGDSVRLGLMTDVERLNDRQFRLVRELVTLLLHEDAQAEG